MKRKWPWISVEAKLSIEQILSQGEIYAYGSHPIIDRLEHLFKARYGVNYALAMSSGTAALHSAFVGLDIKPGDEVIVPTYTFHASATPLLLCGAIPVLCDSESVTGNIDTNLVERLITSLTKAIVVTHLWGHPVEMEMILAIAKKHRLTVVEDASHAVGSKYHGQSVGALGDVAAISLGGPKMITGGMGGVMLTNRRDVYERALVLGHSHERSSGAGLSEPLANVAEAGYGANYRMTLLSALLCSHQFDDLDERIAIKTRNSERLSEILLHSDFIKPPRTRSMMTRGGWYGYKGFYDNQLRSDVDLKWVINALRAEGVDVRRPTTRPLHKLYPFSGCKIGLGSYDNEAGGVRAGVNAFSVADSLYETAIAFPDYYFYEECAAYLDVIEAAVLKVRSRMKVMEAIK